MADYWQDIREAIAAKIAASSGMATAGLRSAVLVMEETGEKPCMAVGEPDFEPLGFSNASVSEYMLTYPVRLTMPVPGGRKRQQTTGAAIMRAFQEEWRTGVKLGLSTLVVDSYVGAAQGIPESEDALPGYGSSVVVQVYETHTARTV